jgi:prevent-host-death family protein
MTDTILGVAEAKKRFSEIVDRVAKGERFVVSRRGKPAVALVSPSDVLSHSRQGPPRGLAAFAGALSEWDELEDVVEEIYAARSRSKDRAVPDISD